MGYSLGITDKFKDIIRKLDNLNSEGTPCFLIATSEHKGLFPSSIQALFIHEMELQVRDERATPLMTSVI